MRCQNRTPLHLEGGGNPLHLKGDDNPLYLEGGWQSPAFGAPEAQPNSAPIAWPSIITQHRSNGWICPLLHQAPYFNSGGPYGTVARVDVATQSTSYINLTSYSGNLRGFHGIFEGGENNRCVGARACAAARACARV